MTLPRLFLLAPETLSAEQVLACATAACAAGDVASIVTSALPMTAKLQALGLAVLNRQTPDPKSDGMHVNQADADVAALRKSLEKDKILGVYCGASRHAAMEAAEAGADYIAFSQNTYTPKEPIIGWWADLFEIPSVAFDPVEPVDLDILLPQKPDFIRPGDAMWASPEAATLHVSALMQRIRS